ncbi:hypothetical protein JXA59_02380 [Patescibacteria group bacterium]|nr:hypothetical protein [Patescibacteria group bacterium]
MSDLRQGEVPKKEEDVFCRSIPLLVAMTSSIRGVVGQVFVLPGHSIRSGDHLMMIDKTCLNADADGVVTAVLVKIGDEVIVGTSLLEVDVRPDALQRLYQREKTEREGDPTDPADPDAMTAAVAAVPFVDPTVVTPQVTSGTDAPRDPIQFGVVSDELNPPIG